MTLIHSIGIFLSIEYFYKNPAVYCNATFFILCT